MQAMSVLLVVGKAKKGVAGALSTVPPSRRRFSLRFIEKEKRRRDYKKR